MFVAILLMLLVPCASQAMFPLTGYTFLSPRSQSVNADRELVGWYRFINLFGQEQPYGALTATPAGGSSFRPERLAQYFFDSDEIVISGSQVTNRLANQLLADYFGLSPLYQSTVYVKPSIVTFLVDFDGYLGYKDFYIRAHAPVVWTRNSLGLREVVINSGAETPYPALYMASSSIQAPATTWTQDVAGGITFGQVVQGIEFGKMPCSKSTAGLAEIQIAIGWNFCNSPRGHAGLNLRGYVPTGTRPKSEVLFEPIVGNGHHGEVGVGFTGHWLLWEKDCYQSLAVYSDINLTHLFGTTQHRSFDLGPNGYLSRYMLVKQFNTSGNYTSETVPLINLTTLPCRVSAAVQLDLVVMFAYTHGRWSFDLGYDAWLRTHENISLECNITPQTLGLKGIQNVATLSGTSNATQSAATIFGNAYSDQAIVADANPPVFINTQDINICSAEAPRAFTNKIFTHLSYIFDPYSSWDPFLGLGGEVEFEGLNPRGSADNNHNSVSQWMIWLKGGIGF